MNRIWRQKDQKIDQPRHVHQVPNPKKIFETSWNTWSVTQPMPALWSRHPPSQRQKAGKPSRRTLFIGGRSLKEAWPGAGHPTPEGEQKLSIPIPLTYVPASTAWEHSPLRHRKLGALHNGGWLRCLAPGLATRHLRWPVSIPDSRNWKISW
jgi:hypothetical protein